MCVYLGFPAFPYVGYKGINWVVFCVVQEANWVCWLPFCKKEPHCPSRIVTGHYLTKILSIFRVVGEMKPTYNSFSTVWGWKELSHQGNYVNENCWRRWKRQTYWQHAGRATEKLKILHEIQERSLTFLNRILLIKHLTQWLRKYSVFQEGLKKWHIKIQSQQDLFTVQMWR